MGLLRMKKALVAYFSRFDKASGVLLMAGGGMSIRFQSYLRLLPADDNVECLSRLMPSLPAHFCIF
jgi:hypothetical protein